MLCDKCCESVKRELISLQNIAVTMNALGCDSPGECDAGVMEELGKLVQICREEGREMLRELEGYWTNGRDDELIRDFILWFFKERERT